MMSLRPPEWPETNDSRGWVPLPDWDENARTGRSEARKWHVEIPGRLPGLNEYIEAERRNRFKAAKLKAEAQDWVLLCVKKYMRGVEIKRPVYIRYNWHEPNRRRDKSNVSGYGRKVIEDALVQAGVLADDGWDEIEGFEDRFYLDKANPRIVVEIEEVVCRDTTTPDAADTTARAVSASTAPTTTTGTKATLDAVHGTGAAAGTARSRARSTRKKGG